MDESLVSGWESFFTAFAGVGAALAGLIIVAITVTIKEIIASRSLPARAGATIGTLVLVVVSSGLMLIPRQSITTLGVELLIAGLVALVFQVISVVRIFQERPVRPMIENVLKCVLEGAQIVPYLIGSVLVLLAAPSGMNWIAIGILVMVACAMVNAWVLLVEVLR